MKALFYQEKNWPEVWRHGDRDTVSIFLLFLQQVKTRRWAGSRYPCWSEADLHLRQWWSELVLNQLRMDDEVNWRFFYSHCSCWSTEQDWSPMSRPTHNLLHPCGQTADVSSCNTSSPASCVEGVSIPGHVIEAGTLHISVHTSSESHPNIPPDPLQLWRAARRFCPDRMFYWDISCDNSESIKAVRLHDKWIVYFASQRWKRPDGGWGRS